MSERQRAGVMVIGGKGWFMSSSEHNTATARVEDDEVFHKDRLALRLACHGFPCAYNTALDIFRDRDAGDASISDCRGIETQDLPRLLCKSDITGSHLTKSQGCVDGES